MLHLPVLRAGRAYRSLKRTRLADLRTGEPFAELSQANPGMIGWDLRAAAKHHAALARIPVADLLAACRKAAALFAEAELPLDSEAGTSQTADDYVAQLSATSGLPRVMCRANMEKIRFVLAEMERVLGGLTRGLDLAVLDGGWATQGGRMLSYQGQAEVLGAVLPSNSPGVHSLWLPAIPLKVPLLLKPGSLEPWTPLRVAQAFIGAGVPAEAFGVYPTDHAGASQILLRCGRSMVFGDANTVRPWLHDPRVQIHGPGWSKVILGADQAPHWEQHLELFAASVADNGGRSCLNASGIWLPSHGRAVADAVARRLARIEPRGLDDPQAGLAAFPVPAVAHAVSAHIDRLLEQPGAEDVSARVRDAARVVEVDGCTFLRPTVIRCDDPDHPVVRCEFMFPFVTVVEAPQAEILGRIGTTLVGTGLTEDPAFRDALMRCRTIDRLNLGPFPTSRISWDQPHEGNLFEHLYHQRALQLDTERDTGGDARG